MNANNEVSGARPEEENNSNIITELTPRLNPFKKFGMTEESMKAIDEMEYLIDGFIVKGYHTYLFGNAGGGKTTIAFFLAKEILERFENMNVVFFYIDGTASMAKNAMESFIDIGLQDRMTIAYAGTVDDYINELTQCITNKVDLSNTFIIFDTFKYLTSDINNKNSNKKAMAFLKQLCHDTGATFLSLGHTNKDGEKQSGTAEIEQDSDAIFRIDSMTDADIATSTIMPAGRCRLDPITQTFNFTRGDVTSVQRLDNSIDIGALAYAKAARTNDAALISEVKSILTKGVEKTQTEIVELLNDLGIGKQKLVEKLKYYVTRGEWEIKKGTNNATIYFINHEENETIARLTGV
ncbi:MAG: AAA family ATPase [Sulfuricurvum sp.]|nr:AAA family ATPase [Sulfuricurvum sp.]